MLAPAVPSPARPVVLVHGIWDSAARLEPLRRGLSDRGFTDLVPFDLRPNTGSAPIEQLGAQLDAVARAALDRSPDGRLDLVGFSMGALVSRWWLQRGGGRGLVRTFVSLSGPHRGTVMALPLSMLPGVRQMRPGSPLLRDLAADPDPWGATRVHCIYTPYDLMIVPSTSSILAGAHSVEAVPVAIHRRMLSDARVLDAVAARLREG